MGLFGLFFAFRGRISRGQWWLGTCGLLVAAIAASVLLGFLLLYAFPIDPVTIETMTTADRITEQRSSPALNIAMSMLVVGFTAMFLMLSAKRLRDAGASLGLLILAVVPVAMAFALPRLLDAPGAAAMPLLIVGSVCFVPLWAVLGFRRSRALSSEPARS